MSNETMYDLITGMHIKLNRLIISKDFHLLGKDVQHYSQRLDRVLARYNRSFMKNKCMRI